MPLFEPAVESAIDIVTVWPMTTISATFALYVVLLYTYRLTLHQLARYPGPPLAAMTLWYEFYYDFFRGGQYIFRILDMHTKYGHIVRITPDEVHVNDPSSLPELMPGGGRRQDKYSRMIRGYLASRKQQARQRITTCTARGERQCPRCSPRNPCGGWSR